MGVCCFLTMVWKLQRSLFSTDVLICNKLSGLKFWDKERMIGNDDKQ